MTEHEIRELLGPEDYHRGIVAEHDHKIVAWVGWNRLGDQFYAYALFCNPDHPYAWPLLMQALRKTCKACGKQEITFAVDLDNTEFLNRMLALKRTRVVSYLMQMEA